MFNNVFILLEHSSTSLNLFKRFGIRPDLLNPHLRRTLTLVHSLLLVNSSLVSLPLPVEVVEMMRICLPPA